MSGLDEWFPLKNAYFQGPTVNLPEGNSSWIMDTNVHGINYVHSLLILTNTNRLWILNPLVFVDVNRTILTLWIIFIDYGYPTTVQKWVVNDYLLII